MNDPEREFDERIAAIHGLDNPKTSSLDTGERNMDIRHAEFQAMADAFLGKDFDETKLRQVEDVQVALHNKEDKLYQSYEAGKLTREEYVESANAAFQESLEKCEDILGQENFVKLFGAPRSDAAGLVDKEAFFSSHQSRQGNEAESESSYVVEPDDQSLISGTVEYPGKAGSVRAYLSRPDSDSGYGGVIVVHGESGLGGHIKDISRRFAKEGFIALAPDFLSRPSNRGKYKTRDEITEAIKEQLSQENVREDLNSAVTYLKMLDFCNGSIGVVGYSWGGQQALNFAATSKDIDAAIVYYGSNPDSIDVVENISCPVMGNYSSDTASELYSLREALFKYQKTFETKEYPGTTRDFTDNTNPERYHLEAAADAWTRTVRFLRKSLYA